MSSLFLKIFCFFLLFFRAQPPYEDCITEGRLTSHWKYPECQKKHLWQIHRDTRMELTFVLSSTGDSQAQIAFWNCRSAAGMLGEKIWGLLIGFQLSCTVSPPPLPMERHVTRGLEMQGTRVKCPVPLPPTPLLHNGTAHTWPCLGCTNLFAVLGLSGCTTNRNHPNTRRTRT